MGCFLEVCRRRGLKINAGKSKVIALNGEGELECEVCVDGKELEHVSEFKYLGCVLDEAVSHGKRVAGAIRSMVNSRGLQPKCARVLYEILLVPVLMYTW